jgi:tetratricopeptide (TPR) repeat protein
MSRIDHLLDFLREDPSDAFVLYSLAQEYIKEGDTGNALEYFIKLRQHDPDYVGMYYHLGKLYEALEDHSQALKTYEEGIAVAHAQGDAHAASELRGAMDLLRALMDD